VLDGRADAHEVGSSKVRPTIWTPVGTPLSARPEGTASTGWRLSRLKGQVNTFPIRWACDSGVPSAGVVVSAMVGQTSTS